MYERTRETTVTGEIEIWAVPRTAWEMEQAADAGEEHPIPFKFKLSTGKVWTDGAVKLNTQDISVVCPGGIDLLSSALATLREEKEEERRNFEKRIVELDQKIQALAMLTYIPEGE